MNEYKLGALSVSLQYTCDILAQYTRQEPGELETEEQKMIEHNGDPRCPILIYYEFS